MKPRIEEIVVFPNLYAAQKLFHRSETLRNPTVLPNPQLLMERYRLRSAVAAKQT